MHTHFLTILSTADLPTRHQEKSAMQQRLMHNFYMSMNENFRQQVSGNDFDSPICGSGDKPSWEGVYCSRIGYVIGVNHASSPAERSDGNFNLECLAPTVEDLDLSNCSQRYEVVTRSLPAHLQSLNLSINMIYGTFDVAGLPQTIRWCNMAYNAISGTVQLVQVPQALEEIDLSDNQLTQRIVYYSNLPKSFHRACLLRMKIKEFRPLLDDDKKNASLIGSCGFLCDVSKVYQNYV